MSVNTFSDSILKCQVSFRNNNYDLRAANAVYTDDAHIGANIVIDKFYNITIDYPIYDDSWKKNYVVTGEHCLQFNMFTSMGNKTPLLLETTIIETEIIKNLIDKCSDEKLTKISIEVSAFMISSPLYHDKPQSITIAFDYHRRNLFINRIICQLPVDLCDMWFEYCIRTWILDGAYKKIT